MHLGTSVKLFEVAPEMIVVNAVFDCIRWMSRQNKRGTTIDAPLGKPKKRTGIRLYF
jgi:hypothetical protein